MGVGAGGGGRRSGGALKSHPFFLCPRQSSLLLLPPLRFIKEWRFPRPGPVTVWKTLCGVCPLPWLHFRSCVLVNCSSETLSSAVPLLVAVGLRRPCWPVPAGLSFGRSSSLLQAQPPLGSTPGSQGVSAVPCPAASSPSVLRCSCSVRLFLQVSRVLLRFQNKHS